MSQAPKRIAILGGGISALTTAYYLTQQPGWKRRLDITVYQQGWRLGGKGASGRNPDMADRIEEHGLHIFFGFYENAFALMRDVYRELGRNPHQPLAAWTDAFKKHDLVVMEQLFQGEWHHWPLDFPQDSGTPGDGHVLPTPLELLERLVNFLLSLLPDLFGAKAAAEDDLSLLNDLDPEHLRSLIDEVMLPTPTPFNVLDALRRRLRAVASSILEAFGHDIEATFAHLALRLLRDLSRKTQGDALAQVGFQQDLDRITWLLQAFRRWVAKRVEHAVNVNLVINRAFTLLDLSLTITVGVLVDGLIFPHEDWYKVDNTDIRSWLKRHGAAPSSVNSPPVTTLIDAVYASHANVGAGTILYCMFRLLFTYKGAILYKMQAGMGDVIFGPLYEVLKRRGVKFRFFNQVKHLGLSAGPARDIDTIHIDIQAHIKDDAEYQPLVDVKGLPSWPDRPRYEQLVEGDAIRDGHHNLENWWGTWQPPAQQVLRRGQDFDLAVLGIGLGALPYLCGELAADNPRFAAMLQNVKTAQTVGIQVWLRPELEQLGWPMPSAIGIAYADPLDTWADMSHLLPHEAWPEGAVGTLIYNTSSIADQRPLPPRDDHAYPFEQQERIKLAALEWWSQHPRHLFPNATETNDPESINWAWLHDPLDREGPARFDAQFWIGVWNPSDRYVLSVAGSNAFRLRAQDSGYPSLFLTGDWLLTSIAAGCVECAVQSGMSTSRAMSGYPQHIVGEWLPQTPLPNPLPIPPLPPPRPPAQLPPYIRRAGDMMAFQPYLARGTTMFNFVIQADYAKLEAMCNRELNLGGSTTYKPAGPFVAFVAADVKAMGSVLPGYEDGWVREVDYGFWVPLVAGRQVGPLFFPERLVWYMPYLWVDSGVAAEGGREIFGFQKSLGVLRGPQQPGDPAAFSVDTLVIPVYAPTSEARVLPLLELYKTDRSPLGDLSADFQEIEGFALAFAEQLAAISGEEGVWVPTLTFVLNLLRDAFQGRVPMVFLKQFPDITDGTRAAYQAICECVSSIAGAFSGSFLPGDYELALHTYDSHRIIENLGLSVIRQDDQGRSIIATSLHFAVQMDFHVDNGTVIFKNSRA